MHSYSHKYNEIYESKESFAEDLTKLRDYLYEVTGVESRLYRFPGGSFNTVSQVDMGELIDYLAEQEITYFDWNVSSGDASGKTLSVEQIVDNCTENMDYYNNAFILLHDSKEKIAMLAMEVAQKVIGDKAGEEMDSEIYNKFLNALLYAGHIIYRNFGG